MSRISFRATKVGRIVVAAVLAVVFSAAATTVGSSASYANSATFSALESASSWLQMDVNGASTAPGAGIVQWYPNGGNNQQFTYPATNNEFNFIINKNSGMCITTDGVAGHQLFQEPCGGGWGRYQLWYVTIYTPWFDYTDTYGWFTNPASGLVIDVNGDSHGAGASIIGWYGDGGLNQSWILT